MQMAGLVPSSVQRLGVLSSLWKSFMAPTLLQAQPSRTVWGNVNRPNPRGKNRPNKHRSILFRAARNTKVLRIKLPDVENERKMASGTLSPDEMRAEIKRMGIVNAIPYREFPMTISSTGGALDPFLPPEGDGKAAVLSREGARQRTVDHVMRKGKSFRAVRKIRSFDEDFDPRTFVEDAQQIYIDAHKALAEKNTKRMHELATEKAYPEMMHNAEKCTIYWEFIKSLEPPQVVHVRTAEVVTKQNLFAQVTIRFHTQQILAVYDRFGRLVHGHPYVAKDVLEYVVFEKHLANLYGSWRLHMKIIPDWLKREMPAGRLTRVVEPDVEEENVEKVEKKSDDADEKSDEFKATEDKEESIVDRFGRAIGKSK